MVTYVNPVSGERSELSAASLANSAAKIANALRSEFDLEPGAVVGLRIPPHWQRAAWCAGTWTAGCAIDVDTVEADLIVAGPAEARTLAEAGARDVAVVSLHPFGLPIAEILPAGCLDVTLTVRQQPDAYLFEPPGPDDLAIAGTRAATQGDVLQHAADLAERWDLSSGGRLLVDRLTRPEDAWLGAFAVPLVIGGSVVIVDGIGDGAELREQERITAIAR
jgi:uncharacterized protein (TIGR03089 family)